jgi:Trk K+ transport system NAD-binding subunit/uncharacterized membrane protein
MSEITNTVQIQTNPISEQNPQDLQGHIIICGLQNTGYRILEQLLKTNIPTIVIDNNPDPRFAEMAQAQGVQILKRDSRTEFGLRNAGVTGARSIIAVTENDLYNLETILAACEIAPTIRAVASFYNSQIGEQLIKSIPTAQALSISELAAATFVTASLPSQVLHLFEIEHEEMAVVIDRVGRNGTIQQLYGQVTPIMRHTGLLNSFAVEQGAEPLTAPSNYASTQICPPSATTLVQGDTVTLVGPVKELIRLDEVSLDERQVAAARKPGKSAKTKMRKRNLRPSFGDFFKSFQRNIDKRLRNTLYASSILIIFGITVFMLVKPNYNLADALYDTMITISSNYTPSPTDTWLFKLFGVFIIIVGTALLGVIYAYITNFIVTARIAEALGKQKATNMENHVVMTGLGAAGYTVLKGLVERGEEVAVLELNEHSRFVALARNLGVPVIHADARVAESLDLVNINKARCITIMTNDDLANLETALNARARNPRVRVVLRLFDRNLAERTEKTFKIEIARSTSALAAPYFIAAALNFEVVTSFYVERTPFFVAKLKIKPGSQLSNLHTREVYTKAGVMVMAYVPRPAQVTTEAVKAVNAPALNQFPVRQLAPIFQPKPDQQLEAGDVIYFVGSYERITSAYNLNN